MRFIKYYGQTYEVRPTGIIRRKSAKSYYDFNGYWTERAAAKIIQLGCYDKENNLFCTINENGEMFKGSSKSFGKSSIKEQINA